MGCAEDKLAAALDELMLEKPLDSIRAVEIAERAGVTSKPSTTTTRTSSRLWSVSSAPSSRSLAGL